MEVPTQTGEAIYLYSDLVFATYENLFIKLYFTDGMSYKVEMSVKQLLQNLPQRAFFLCSRNTIINVCRYRSYDALEYEILMDNGMKVNVSSRKMTAFRKHKYSLPTMSLPCANSDTCVNENCPDRLLFCSPEKPDDFSQNEYAHTPE